MSELRPALVCHADILGWAESIREAYREGRSREHLNSMRSAIDYGYSTVRQYATPMFEGTMPPIAVRTFTDNILASFPANFTDRDQGEFQLDMMLDTFGMLQALLCTKGLVVRGGIGLGTLFVDNEFVYGDALLDAAERDRSGEPPRIALSERTEKLVANHMKFYGDEIIETPYHTNLLVDDSGTLFLNYLEQAFIAFGEAGIFWEVIEGHRDMVCGGMKRYSDRPKIRAKYEWLAGYHNFVCRNRHDMGLSFSDPDLAGAVEMELARLVSSSIDVQEEDFPAPRALDAEWLARHREPGL
jgi:hypothetical protein